MSLKYFMPLTIKTLLAMLITIIFNLIFLFPPDFLSQITILWFGLAILSPVLCIIFLLLSIKSRKEYRIICALITVFSTVVTYFVFKQFGEWVDNFDYKMGSVELAQYESAYFRIIYFATIFPASVAGFSAILTNLRRLTHAKSS